MNSSNLNLNAIHSTTSVLIDDHLRAGRTLRLTVSTSSMRPTLVPTDQVIVTAALPHDLRPGDIVVRNLANIWIAHRLIQSLVTDDGIHLLTKGDNALTMDEAWRASQFVARVIAVERAGKKKSLRFRRAGPGGSIIAWLSRCQASAGDIKSKLFRRIATRILRVGLQVALWTAQ